MMLIFSGLIFVLKSNADYVMEVSLLLMFYGVYYGVLGRDIAEMCVDFMAASMTVRRVAFWFAVLVSVVVLLFAGVRGRE